MKTAFVTGGSGGIGSQICKTLSENGYAVAIGYCRNKKSADTLCSELRENNKIAISVPCDVTNSESVQKTVQLITNGIGYPQVLINNAGTAKIGLFTDLSNDELIRLVNENLTGAMIVTKAFLPEMIRQHYGKIINISSVWGEIGASCETVYSAAKAGLIGFTKALAKETAPSGINVNCISAGLIDTKMNSELSTEDIKAVINEIPAGKIGTPTDISEAVNFLISDKSQYINGQVLRIDGAWC